MIARIRVTWRVIRTEEEEWRSCSSVAAAAAAAAFSFTSFLCQLALELGFTANLQNLFGIYY